MLRQTLVLKCLQNGFWLLHEKNHLISRPRLLSDIQYILPFIPMGHFTGDCKKNIDRTLQKSMQIYHKDSFFGEIKTLRSCMSTIKTFCTDMFSWQDRRTSSLHSETGGWLILPLCPCYWRNYLPQALRECVCYQLTVLEWHPLTPKSWLLSASPSPTATSTLISKAQSTRYVLCSPQ